jgi:ATP-binding cassette subfamily B protein
MSNTAANPKIEAVRYTLATHLMFVGLSAEDKQALAGKFLFKQYPKDTVIAGQGEQVDGMYIVYQGRIRLKQTKDGKRTSLGELGRDATIGESSLLQPIEWPYTVEAVETVIALKLPAEEVRRLLPAHQSMANAFKTQVGLVELGQRLRGILGTARYTNEQFSAILSRIGLKSLRKGAAVFQQGQEDPRLYFIELGAVDLIRRTVSGEDIVLDRVSRDHLIGEGGAVGEGVGDRRHEHTARAVTETTVLVINQPEVQAILKINPGLEEQLRNRYRELKKREQEELDVKDRAEGVNQRIRLSDAVTEEEFRSRSDAVEVVGFPEVRQTREEDCAAACLTMIARHYGKEYTLGQIREFTNLSTAGLTPNLIITGAEQLGLQSKAYALRLQDLRTVQMPGIVGWEGYHYVVVYAVTAKHVHIADPASGIKKVPIEDFQTGWTQAEVSGVERSPDRGVFIGIAPTEAFLRREPPKNPIYHFLGYVLPFKLQFGEALIAALTLNLLGLASPLFVQNIVDTVVVHKDVSLLNVMLAGMVIVALFQTLAVMSQQLLLSHTTNRIDLRLMSEFYRHVLSLPMNFFLTRNKGEILSRFGENETIRAIMTGSSISVVMNTLMIVVYLLMMIAYNLKLTIIAMLFIPGYFGVVWYFVPRIKAIAQQVFEVRTQADAYLIESLNGIEAIKASSNEYMARARWENQFVEAVNMGYRSQKLNLLSGSFYDLVNLSSQVTILWLGANAVMANDMTIGELMGFNMLLGLVMGPILQMLDLWNQLQSIRISIDRVGDVLNVEPEQGAPSPDAMPVTLLSCKGHVKFEKVNFSYVSNGRDNAVMRDFDLTIEPGMRVAFVGPSGCGKSTIAKMVLAFNIPQGGLCTIDGQDIRQIERSSLRRNIGVVLQDSFLFSGTVAENIALGDPDPDMAAVKEAARLAGADEFVVNYPLGYQTIIGEKGMGISGGQRQRICIARALYHKPKILIFDEATSALDNESEARIQQNMGAILRGRTSFTIAHRLTTVIDSDMICFIADGKVQEKGTHAQLIDPEYLRANGYAGRYYRMATTQFDLPPLKL